MPVMDKMVKQQKFKFLVGDPDKVNPVTFVLDLGIYESPGGTDGAGESYPREYYIKVNSKHCYLIQDVKVVESIK